MIQEMYKTILVSPGNQPTFWMGPYPEEVSDLRPLGSPVPVPGRFRLGETQVTQKLWTTFMGKFSPRRYTGEKGLPLIGEDLPVHSVNLRSVAVFCNRLSRHCGLESMYRMEGSHLVCDWAGSGWRLPTGAEWEWAARSGDRNQRRAGAGSERDLYRYCNYADECFRQWLVGSMSADAEEFYEWDGESDGFAGLAPVASFAPNGFGFYDMLGNVEEMCISPGMSGERLRVNLLELSSHTEVKGSCYSQDWTESLIATTGVLLPRERSSRNGFRMVRRADD